jgi:hypothetical protein
MQHPMHTPPGPCPEPSPAGTEMVHSFPIELLTVLYFGQRLGAQCGKAVAAGQPPLPKALNGPGDRGVFLRAAAGPLGASLHLLLEHGRSFILTLHIKPQSTTSNGLLLLIASRVGCTEGRDRQAMHLSTHAACTVHRCWAAATTLIHSKSPWHPAEIPTWAKRRWKARSKSAGCCVSVHPTHLGSKPWACGATN